VRNEVTGTQSSSTVTPAAGTWNTLQLHVRIANRASLIEVGFNGAMVDALSGTDSLGTAPVGQVQLGENANNLSYTLAFDDVAVSPMAVLAGGPIERKFYLPVIR
jgi:hypothetical protein